MLLTWKINYRVNEWLQEKNPQWPWIYLLISTWTPLESGFSPSIIIDAHYWSEKHGPYSKSLPRNSHRKKNDSFNTYPSAMQPSGCAFCQTYLFRVFIYCSKKNIHLVDTTLANSMPSTRCISKWTCTSMKLVEISFSNAHTISAISFLHFWHFTFVDLLGCHPPNIRIVN